MNTNTTISDKHGYSSVRTDAEWDYLFNVATRDEVNAVLDEIVSAGEADPQNEDLRLDLQRIYKAKHNAIGRQLGLKEFAA